MEAAGASVRTYLLEARDLPRGHGLFWSRQIAKVESCPRLLSKDLFGRDITYHDTRVSILIKDRNSSVLAANNIIL